MSLAWVADENRLHFEALERHKHFFSLRDVHVVVVLPVNEERRRLHLPHITQWRVLPQQIEVVPRKAAKLRVHEILVERRRIKTDQVTQARNGNCTSKTRRLRDDP